MAGLSDPELDGVIEQMFSLISRFTMHLCAVVEQAEALDRPTEVTAPSLATWLRGRFGLTTRDASRSAASSAPAAAGL